MNLQQRTESYTLKQLIKILYLKEDYSNEAVAAAEAELDNRNVSREEVDEILKEVELEDERNSAPNILQKQRILLLKRYLFLLGSLILLRKKKFLICLKGLLFF